MKAGEHILFAKYAGSEVTIEDQEFLISCAKMRCRRVVKDSAKKSKKTA